MADLGVRRGDIGHSYGDPDRRCKRAARDDANGLAGGENHIAGAGRAARVQPQADEALLGVCEFRRDDGFADELFGQLNITSLRRTHRCAFQRKFMTIERVPHLQPECVACAQAGWFDRAAGRTVGVITSGSLAPSVGTAVALAYVDCAQTSHKLEVQSRGAVLPATVVTLPFYTAGTARG